MCSKDLAARFSEIGETAASRMCKWDLLWAIWSPGLWWAMQDEVAAGISGCMCTWAWAFGAVMLAVFDAVD